MTIERGNQEQGNNERDELVSKTYRGLADERTPEHLNEKVLRMATDQCRSGATGSPLLAAWFKPVALAATVGITLAIAIEVTQVTNLQEGSTATPATATVATPTESVRDRFIPQGTDVIAEAERLAKVRVGPDPVNNATSDKTPESIAPSSPRPAVEDATPNFVAPSSPQPEAEVATPNFVAPSSPGPEAEDATPADAQARLDVAASDEAQPKAEVAVSRVAERPLAKRQTEEGKRDEIQRRSPSAANTRSMAASATHDFSNTEASGRIDSAVAVSRLRLQEKNASVGARACNCSARKSPESWFACIEKLSESGKVEGAARENEAFELQHPDFLPTK